MFRYDIMMIGGEFRNCYILSQLLMMMTDDDMIFNDILLALMMMMMIMCPVLLLLCGNDVLVLMFHLFYWEAWPYSGIIDHDDSDVWWCVFSR